MRDRYEREIALLTRLRNTLHAERHAAVLSSDLTESIRLRAEIRELDNRLALLRQKHQSLEPPSAA